MEMNPYAIDTLVLSASLLAFVGALILSPKFRLDLSAHEGTLSFLGASAKGVTVFIFASLLVVGLLYVLDKYSQNNPSEPAIRLSQLPSEVVGGNPSQTIEKINKLLNSKSTNATGDIVTRLKALTYDDDASGTIRSFPKEHIGPWSFSGNAKSWFLSVPQNIEKGQAFGCPSQEGNFYEIRSNLPNDAVKGESQIIKITNDITIAQDCEKRIKFIQVPCNIARTVLSDSVVTCDGNDQPRWKIQKNNLIPIWLTRVSAPSDGIQ